MYVSPTRLERRTSAKTDSNRWCKHCRKAGRRCRSSSQNLARPVVRLMVRLSALLFLSCGGHPDAVCWPGGFVLCLSKPTFVLPGACESCPATYDGKNMGYDEAILTIATKYGISWLPWAWRPGNTGGAGPGCMDINGGENPAGDRTLLFCIFFPASLAKKLERRKE